jgi:hypothetical protein
VELKPTGPDAAREPRSLRWLWYAGLAAAYLAAAGPLAYYARDAINPDGVAYVQTARHWAAGRVDLAVNGWFSPLLSWLLVPAVWLGVEPFAAARVLGVLYGLLFAAGAVRLTAAMGGRRFSLWAFGTALLLSLRTVFAEATPDFLMTAGLTWFYALAAEMIAAPASRRMIVKAVLTGLVGGACYLAKAYALPVVLVTLALAAVFRLLTVREEAKPTSRSRLQSAIPFAVAMGVAIVVCIPWIVAISAQFGRLTTSTAASLAARSWPAGVPMEGSYPHYAIQRPREGRIGAWENPAEAKGDWPRWHSEEGVGWTFGNQMKAISYNLKMTFLGDTRGRKFVTPYLSRFDVFMTLTIGWAAAFVLALIPRWAGSVRALWLWGCLAAAVYLGGYIVLYFYERFTWGMWGLLIAMAAGVLSRLSAPAATPARPAGKKEKTPPPAAKSSAGWTASIVLAVVVLVSIGYRLVERIQAETSDPASESRMAAWIRQAASGFAQKDQRARIVSDDWPKGLYFAYWTGSVFLGQYPSGDTRRDDPARELRPFAPATVLVYENPDINGLAPMLAQVPGFAPRREEKYAAAGWRLVEMTFDPNAAPAGAGR